MPGPSGLPTGVWEEAETREMEDVVDLYGKTYHFWQVDRGDKLPLGGPELMVSFTDKDQCPGFSELVGERDQRFGTSFEQKAKKREYIEDPGTHHGLFRSAPCCICEVTKLCNRCRPSLEICLGYSEILSGPFRNSR